MANTIGSTLDPYFTQLITSLMVIERAPLQRVTTQRDEITVKRGAYGDINNYLRELQGLSKNLISTSPNYALTTARSATVAAVTSGTSVVSATAGSTAQAGTYQLSVSTLATQHVVRSNQQATAEQALGLAGTLRLGGAATRSVTNAVTASTPLSGFEVSALEAGQTELGDSTYFVETRQDGATWQFRLVNAEGKAVSLRKADGTGYTTGWQAAPTAAGAFDTGRGLTLTFSGPPTVAQNWQTGAASVQYHAQGAAITVAAGDSLNNIASAINSATYADGNGLSASVVDRQLVLTARHTGLAYSVRALDESGTVLGTLGVLTGSAFAHQTAGLNAVFSVNGISVSRSQNTGLDDVITGVTLNLAADAEGRSAKLTISADSTAGRTAVDAFVAKFNSVQTYLQVKTQISSETTGEVTTYTRGTLGRDSIFSDLRTELFSRFMSPAANAGQYQGLRAIGLVIDDNLQASVADPALLEAALKDNPADTALLLDQVMSDFDTYLNRFTQANTGFLDQAAGTLASEIEQANTDIANLNSRLTTKEANLYQQFSEVQSQLMLLSYMQQQWSTIYNTYG